MSEYLYEVGNHCRKCQFINESWQYFSCCPNCGSVYPSFRNDAIIRYKKMKSNHSKWMFWKKKYDWFFDGIGTKD